MSHLFALQTLEELESEMLNGQKLQGPPTAAEVNTVLRQKGMEDKYDTCTCVWSVHVCVCGEINQVTVCIMLSCFR